MGQHLAQRVGAERPRASYGITVLRVQAETRLVRGVAPGSHVSAVLDPLISMASLSSLVFDPAGRVVAFRSSVVVHEQNVERLKWVFTHAVAIQAAEANGRAAPVARELGGEVAVSAHPSSGVRDEPDGMLAVIQDVYYPQGQAPRRSAGITSRLRWMCFREAPSSRMPTIPV